MLYFTEGRIVALVVRLVPPPHITLVYSRCGTSPAVGHIPNAHHRPRRARQVRDREALPPLRIYRLGIPRRRATLGLRLGLGARYRDAPAPARDPLQP